MSSIQLAENITVRLALRREIPAIRAMQEHSLAVLGAPYYSAAELNGFIATTGTMDDAVVEEGHYFIGRDGMGRVVVSGGWSQREPGYDRARTTGATDSPRTGGATIRSVFIDPAFARRGIASALMCLVEHDAIVHGVHRLRLMATLSGEAFYARLGWHAEGRKTIGLPGGLQFGCVSMTKQIAAIGLNGTAADRLTTGSLEA